ncbi:MAG: bifunctional 4-hydroxy-2-oxoglutarate aldolase/2-dehydro-3-deoxy-phosphogluconate aldolase [Clostridiales bacterium]|nr:bifunctional 4-hydroxy-2-oxoglutarate aldolase/2-dehydro-3-deoxy-phosphogluconate aldolase [Clostridiales bacterium]
MGTLERILEEKIIAIVRGLTLEETVKTVGAIRDGGIRLSEIPFDQTKPLSWTTDKISAVKETYGAEGVLVGAGTVLTVEQVQAAKEAGAEYIITPTSNREVIEETKRLGLVAMPGAMTPTEIEQCYRWGADIVKIFPSDNLGTGFIKAVRGPLFYIPLSAVGGVNLDNIRSFFEAGVCSVGIGGNIVNKKMIAAGDYEGIRKLAAAYVEKLH